LKTYHPSYKEAVDKLTNPPAAYTPALRTIELLTHSGIWNFQSLSSDIVANSKRLLVVRSFGSRKSDVDWA
jgi:hypothetical protein